MLGRAAAQGRDPLDALQRMFFAQIDFIAGHPAIPRVLMSEHLHGRSTALRQLVTEIMLGYEAKIAGLLADAQAQGLARADLDTHAAATLYIGMIQGLVLQTSILRGQRTLTAKRRTFPVYLQAIRPPPRSPHEIRHAVTPCWPEPGAASPGCHDISMPRPDNRAC